MEWPEIADVRTFACILHGTDAPIRSQETVVRQMCRDGRIKHADKVGRSWYINVRREMPNCFGE